MHNPKLLSFLFSVIVSFQMYSQKRIIGKESSSPIPYAHILLDNKIYSYSDENGAFTIAANQRFNTLTISHLSYETLALSYAGFLKSDTIRLHEKATLLNELVISPSKKKKRTLTLLPDKSARDKLYTHHNIRLLLETASSIRDEDTPADAIHILKAVYVPNEKQIENAVVKKIILTSVPAKKPGDERYAPFKVNLMTYDTINKIPGERIFAEDLPAGKKRGETVIIDLSKEEPVTFPKEGICILVSVYDTQYYTDNGNMKPPSFRAASLSKTSAFREYAIYGKYQEQWEENLYSKLREQCFDFGIEIEYYK